MNASRYFVLCLTMWAGGNIMAKLMTLATEKFPVSRPPVQAWQEVVALVMFLALCLWGVWILIRTKDGP